MFSGFVPVITSITGAESSKPQWDCLAFQLMWATSCGWKCSAKHHPAWIGTFQVSRPKQGVISASRWHYGLRVLFAFLFFILGLDRLCLTKMADSAHLQNTGLAQLFPLYPVQKQCLKSTKSGGFSLYLGFYLVYYLIHWFVFFATPGLEMRIWGFFLL